MTRKTIITAAITAIILCASVAYNLDGWAGPNITVGQTALPLGIPDWML